MATISNARDLNLQATSPRLTATAVTLTPSSSSFAKSKNTVAIAPTFIDIVTTKTGFTVPVYSWYYRSSTSNTFTLITGATSSTYSPTSSVFLTQMGSGVSVEYRCKITQTGWSDAQSSTTIGYSRQNNDVPVATLNKTSIVLPATAADVVTYTDSDSKITVSIGGTNIPYATTGANSFSVTAAVTSGTVVVGTPTTTTTTVTGDTRSFGILSGMATGTASATITYTVTARDIDNVATTITLTQTITKATSGTVGVNAKTITLINDKQAFTFSGTGTLSPLTGQFITFTVAKQNTTNTVTWTTNPAVSLSSSSTVQTTTTTGDTVYLLAAAPGFGTNTSVSVTASVTDGTTITDTTTIVKLQDGGAGLSTILTNESHTIPTDSAGANGTYTGSGTNIYVYEGATALTYDGVGTANGSWTVSAAATNITVGSVTDSGTFATYSDANNIIADTATIIFTITGKTQAGTSFSLIKTQTFSISKTGATGATGNAGPTGAIAVSAYKIVSSVALPASPAAPTTAPLAGTATGTTDWYSSPAAALSTSEWLFQASGTAATSQKLYSILQVYTDSLSTATSSVTWSSTAPRLIGAYNTSGISSSRTAVLELYRWSNTVPTTFPVGNSTYTWSTGSFTLPATPNGWSRLPGAATIGYTLYACSMVISNGTATTTDAVTWSTSTAYAITVATGSSTRTAVLDMYEWKDTTPSLYPSGSSTYTWATQEFTAPAAPNGWTLTPGTIDYTWNSPTFLSTFKVGSLSALSADMGAITAGSLEAVTISSASISASTITGAAISAGTITGAAISAGTISGTGITGGTITGATVRTAETGARIELNTTDLQVYNAAGTSIAKVGPGAGNGGITALAYNYTTSTSSYSTDGTQIGFDVAGNNKLNLNSTGIAYINQNFRPSPDVGKDLGSSGFRWKDIYSLNAVTTGSDARIKTEVESSVLGLNFINALHPVSYKLLVAKKEQTEEYIESTIPGTSIVQKTYIYKDVPGTRRHYGLIAQEVKSVLDSLNTGDFAGFILEDKNDPNSMHSLRYEEFISPLIKAVQELSAKVTALENRLNS